MAQLRGDLEIDAVLFDADGVLQRHRGEPLSSALAALLPDPAHGDAFATEVFAAEAPCLRGLKAFDVELERLLRQWSCTARAADVLPLWHAIEVDVGVLEIVRALRAAGRRVALASNQNSARARYMAADLGYERCFDALYFSCDLGAAKPERAYFDAVLERLGVPGGHVLFIDDHEQNVAGALESGLRAAVFPRNAGAAQMAALLARHGLAA